METAVDDELIRRNLCRIDGAGREESDERRAVIPLPVVFALADTLPPWHRALVLLATFAQLRLGNSRASPETASTSAAASSCYRRQFPRR
jgi:hypothetical protein